jgi:hypothetical protein
MATTVTVAVPISKGIFICVGTSRSEHSAGRSAGPYDRPSGYRRDRPRSLEDVLDGDELLPSDQFSRYAEVEGNADPTVAYKEYLKKHRQAVLGRYFSRHKGEGWYSSYKRLSI